MNNDELRQEHRLSVPLTIFIELIAAHGVQPGTIVVSRSLDVSANGLRVIADRELPVGSILQSSIQDKNFEQRFTLSTEVKWSQPHTHPGEYLIGLTLFESDDTDIQAWKEFISRNIAVNF